MKSTLAHKCIALSVAISFSIITSSFSPSIFQKRSEIMVCVTRTGKKYHRCYHYQGRNQSMTLKLAKKQGYTPCKVCKPPR